MNQQSPVLPGYDFPETIIGANQEGVEPLPAIRIPGPDGEVLTRWDFDPEERVLLEEGASLYLSVLTHGDLLQPVRLWVATPEMIVTETRDVVVEVEPEQEPTSPQPSPTLALVPVPAKLPVSAVPDGYRDTTAIVPRGIQIKFAKYPDGTFEIYPAKGSFIGDRKAKYADWEISVRAFVIEEGRKPFIVVLPCNRAFLDLPGAEWSLTQMALGHRR